VKKDSIIPTPSGSSKRVKVGDLLEGDYFLPMVATGIVDHLDAPSIKEAPVQAVAVPSADTSRCEEKPLEKVMSKRVDLEQLTKADLLKMLPAETLCGFKGDKNELINLILKG